MEAGRHHARILLDQDRQVVGIGHLADGSDRHHGTVFSNVRAGDGDVGAEDELVAAHGLDGVFERLGIEGLAVPVGGKDVGWLEQATCKRHAENACHAQCVAPSLIHAVSLLLNVITVLRHRAASR